MSQIKKRNVAIDYARGVGIILVIFDHINVAGGLSDWRMLINSFYMPMFVIISGYCFKDAPLKDTFISRTKRLLLPYVYYQIFAITVGAIKDLLVLKRGLSVFIQDYKTGFVDLLIGRNIWVLYFLLMLYLSTMFFAIIQRAARDNVYIRWGLVLIFTTIGRIIPMYYTWVPWYLDLGFITVFFFAVGYEYKHRETSIDKKTTVVAFLLCLIFWLTAVFKMDIFFVLALRGYDRFPLCFISAVCGSYVVIKLCKLIDYIPVVKSFIKFCGLNTLLFMCINNVIVRFIDWDSICMHIPFFIQAILQIVFISAVTILWNKFKIGVKALKKA